MSTRTTQLAIRLVLVIVAAGLLAGCSLLRPRVLDPAEYAVTIEAVRLQPVETLALWEWPTSTPIPTAQPAVTSAPAAMAAAHFLPVVIAPQPQATVDATPTDAITVNATTVDTVRLSVMQSPKLKHSVCRYVAAETPMPELIGSTIPPLPPTPTPAPMSPAEAAGCACSADLYTCTDFESVGAAQACFEHCKKQGQGDIHRLDADNDRLACYES